VTLSAGERLGSYEIVSPLGAGGMGEVQYVGAVADCDASSSSTGRPSSRVWRRRH
jgi:hypothetical protein